MAHEVMGPSSAQGNGRSSKLFFAAVESQERYLRMLEWSNAKGMSEQRQGKEARPNKKKGGRHDGPGPMNDA